MAGLLRPLGGDEVAAGGLVTAVLHRIGDGEALDGEGVVLIGLPHPAQKVPGDGGPVVEPHAGLGGEEGKEDRRLFGGGAGEEERGLAVIAGAEGLVVAVEAIEGDAPALAFGEENGQAGEGIGEGELAAVGAADLQAEE